MKTGTRFLIGFAGLGFAILGLSQSSDVVVNGRTLSPSELNIVHRLALRYQWTELGGRYWYDPRTGLYGREGEPPLGVIPAGLAIGGRLARNASNGTSGVYVNGRELTRQEVGRVSQCTVVQPGRYWINADGIGGFEGGPPSFNLAALCSQRKGRSSALGTPGNRGWYGSVTGGGGVVGAIFPGGAGVTCGPGGGCIYSH
jgi:hypothetical protein